MISAPKRRAATSVARNSARPAAPGSRDADTSKPERMMRSTVLLASGQMATYGLSFVRTMILARTLTKADFGLTAVFAMSVTLLELAGRMAFGQQIIQSKQGDCDRFQATTQAFQCTLACAGAVLMVLLSHPMAAAMKVPQLGWAFALLGVIPLTRGLENLDYYRQQRHLRYWPAVLCDLVPQLVVTAAAWPLARWIGDFRVIVVLMITRDSMRTVITHLVARNRYQWGWEKTFVRSMVMFGLPLLFNGLLIFASQQADQMLVGGFLSLEKLAIYALALSLVSIPGSVFAQVSTSLMLPILSRAQDTPEAFRAHYRTCTVIAALAAVFLVGPLVLAGEQFVTLVYGSKYAGAGDIIALLGAAAAVRFLRIVPAIASMARADTMNQLYTNLCRCLSLPTAAALAYAGGDIKTIATCALGAEVAATIVSAVRLRRRQGVPLRDIAAAAGFLIMFVGIAAATPLLGSIQCGYGSMSVVVVAFIAGAAVLSRMLFPAVVREMLTPLRRRLGFAFA